MRSTAHPYRHVQQHASVQAVPMSPVLLGERG